MIRAAAAFCLGAISALLTAIAAGDREATSRAFGSWSRSVSVFLSSVFSFLPISIAELLLYALILLSLITFVRAVVRIFRRRSARPLLSWLSGAALTASCLVFLFLTLWGLNYFATPLSDKSGVEEQSAQALYETSVWLRDEMNSLAGQVPRNEDGICDAGGFGALAKDSMLGYDALAGRGGDFVAGLTPPKRTLFPATLIHFGISGIYIPFTGEAVVESEATDSLLPFTLCHELAHRQGTAPEDEANYYAFLACAAHPDAVFRYSGYHVAFIYCSNALGQADGDLYSRLMGEVSPLVYNDFRAQGELRKKYEGPLRDFGESTNDTYLKAVGQEAGVRSYGLVVDLLIADYLGTAKGESR